MKHEKYLMLDPKLGYPFGVAAESELGTELHGPFPTFETASQYGHDLSEEYSDYNEITVVKIEIPFVSSIALR